MLSTLITLLVTVFVFGLLIFVHELGHYLVARKCGVGVVEFAIGMGPKLKSWEGKYNTFSIRAIPIGGFVNMVGEYDEELPPEQQYKIPLNTKPIWQRILIVLAGPCMNILLAFIVMAILVSTGNVIGSTKVAQFGEQSVSSSYGLMVDDEIIKIDSKRIHCYPDLSYKILSSGTLPVDITVIRDGEEIMLPGVKFSSFTENGIEYGSMDFYVYKKDKTVGTVIYESFWQSVSTVYMTVDSLVDTLSGRYGIDAVGGPIAVGGEISETIKSSVSFVDALQNIATLIVFISVSLGICNLLPIPVLDGGRLLFYIIEAIRGKPMKPKVEQTISAFFMILLILLMVLVALKDIAGLF